MKKEEKNFIRKIIKRCGDAINKEEMIRNNDSIVVAVSGGKDSLSLLDILSRRRKFLPIDYKIHAVHVETRDVPYEIDRSYLLDFCKSRDIVLHILETYAGLKEKKVTKPCFACSWNRRKELFDFVLKNNFKTLAFGHHLDDAIETLIMNMMMHANISSIPASLSMFEEKLKVIRPLIFLTDRELQLYAKINNFHSLKKECPYEDHTMRNNARKIINQMEQINPQARINLFNSMGNIDGQYLGVK